MIFACRLRSWLHSGMPKFGRPIPAKFADSPVIQLATRFPLPFSVNLLSIPADLVDSASPRVIFQRDGIPSRFRVRDAVVSHQDRKFQVRDRKCQ